MATDLILVVDDEENIVRLVRTYLEKDGFPVECAGDGEEALRKAASLNPALIVLDLMLPKVDGWEVCRRIRATSQVPIIVLTARTDDVDKIVGLELGADDYLPKPFEPMELLARVKAVLRRSEAYLLNGLAQERVTVGGITLDPLTLTAHFADGRSVPLTPTEFRLLHCLMRNAGQTLTHDTLMESVWGYDYEGDSNPLPVYIRRLRAKIEERPDQPRRLVTVRGLGYRFEAD